MSDSNAIKQRLKESRIPEALWPEQWEEKKKRPREVAFMDVNLCYPIDAGLNAGLSVGPRQETERGLSSDSATRVRGHGAQGRTGDRGHRRHDGPCGGEEAILRAHRVDRRLR